MNISNITGLGVINIHEAIHSELDFNCVRAIHYKLGWGGYPKMCWAVIKNPSKQKLCGGKNRAKGVGEEWVKSDTN